MWPNPGPPPPSDRDFDLDLKSTINGVASTPITA